MYKKGDRVLLYSLQSFHGPGFYYAHPATVKQDQMGKSIIVVPDQQGRSNPVQESYEVYPEQVKPLTAAYSLMLEEKKELEAVIKKAQDRLNRLDQIFQ